MRALSALVPFLALVAACEGPMGPAGPAGPAGPQGVPGATGAPGPAGGGGAHYFSAVADANGEASAVLPPAAGSLSQPPGLTCYLREPNGTYWLVVALSVDSDGFIGIACLLEQQGTSLVATVIGAPPTWQVLFAAIY